MSTLLSHSIGSLRSNPKSENWIVMGSSPSPAPSLGKFDCTAPDVLGICKAHGVSPLSCIGVLAAGVDSSGRLDCAIESS
eukprot:6049649-Karenia_brevis.AAC.1